MKKKKKKIIWSGKKNLDLLYPMKEICSSQAKSEMMLCCYANSFMEIMRKDNVTRQKAFYLKEQTMNKSIMLHNYI